MPFLQTARGWLELNVHVSAPWVLLTVLVWLAVYTVRKWLPGVWLLIERIGPENRVIANIVQSLPSVLLGALAGVLLTGGDYGLAWKGALFGAIAPVVHWVRKLLPFDPYKGAVGPVAPTRIISGLIVLLALSPAGCAGSFETARRPSLKFGAVPPSERCISLDDARRDWTAWTKASAVLAGASGLATIPVEDEKVRIAVAGGALLVGGFSAFSAVHADALGERWAAECSAP